jgi:hypothetical protein
LLADGAITLTAVGLLAPHLTTDNHVELLDKARHQSKREVEQLVVKIHPRPDVPSSVRRLPVAKPAAVLNTTPATALPMSGPPGGEGDDASAGRAALSTLAAATAGSTTTGVAQPVQASPRHLAVAAPLAPERYKLQITVSRETYEKLRRAQDLLRHTIPNGDPAAIIDRALDALLTDLNRTRLAAASRPGKSRPTTPDSRHIPAAVKRAVWTRDGGRCAFAGARGRCTETGLLEFHHVVPYARGGPAVVDNIELRCRAHNAFEAELDFGPRLPTLVRETGPPYGNREAAWRAG